jgi:hypothetical protein
VELVYDGATDATCQRWALAWLRASAFSTVRVGAGLITAMTCDDGPRAP